MRSCLTSTPALGYVQDQPSADDTFVLRSSAGCQYLSDFRPVYVWPRHDGVSCNGEECTLASCLLPGGDWLDFWTGERISGRQYKSFLTPIEIMPIFLRRGAIIPRQEAMQYVDERPNTNISLLIYPSEHSVYEMYEDDGKSLDYQKGVYAVTKMESRLAQNEWILNITTPKGDYKPVSHYYSVSVYLDKKPKLVTVAGKFVDGWKYDEKLRLLTFDAGEGDMEVVVKM